MDLLGGYGSSASENDDDNEEDEDRKVKAKESPRSTVQTTVPIARKSDRRVLDAAPSPSILSTIRHAKATANAESSTTTTSSSALTLFASKTKSGSGGSSKNQLLMNNPRKSTLMAPVQGPSSSDPNSAAKPESKGNIATMQANVAFDSSTFETQRTAFQRSGVAIGPNDSGDVIIRTSYGHGRHNSNKRALADSSTDHAEIEETLQEDKVKSELAKNKKKKYDNEPLVHNSDDEVEFGIWAPPSAAERDHAADSLTTIQRGGLDLLTPEQIAEREHIAERNRRRGQTEEGGAAAEERENQNFDRLVERKMSHLLPPRMEGEDPEPCEPTTKFHGKALFDYRGKSWITAPSGSDSREEGDTAHHKCYVPKKCVHRFTGHTKGVHRIRLFPNTGHLLLSGGLDGKCKVWSLEQKQVMRTYIGHTAAVRDVHFNSDGTKFLSASFDRFVRLWNTETGVVENTFTNRRVPYVVKFYPKDEQYFVAGCSDNKIVTYDSISGEITQEYNHHLAPVNAIVFVDDGGGGASMKMVTSSDDKKVLVWEWDIGVPIKYLSDPTMHSMPVMTMHPSGMYIICQSLDNQIVVYQAGDRFALQRKKKFTGHQVSGYACDIAASPDGQFVVSGDGDGKINFWDWRRHKMLQKYRGHDNGPSIGCVWHPVEPSTVLTCGWDGVIKMWQ